MAHAIARLGPEHLEALRRFFDALPDEDVTFIKEDVRSPALADAWVADDGPARRWVAVGEDGAVLGLVSVRPLVGWSSHVGDLRLVVDPARRGEGLGRALAMHGLREGLNAGLTKIAVEVVAQQEGAVRMFTDLGFRAEALLCDHIRDRSGELQDLLVLAHDAGGEWSSMSTVGIEGEVG